MTQTNMHKILNDLKWQIEAGIDEVISDKPIVFSNEENIKENKKIKNVSSKNLDQFQNINDLRNYLKNIFRGNQSSGKDNYFEDSNEDIAFVKKTIDSNSFGEIKYKGTFYRAQSKNKIKEGVTVKVLGKGDEQGSFFIVDKLS